MKKTIGFRELVLATSILGSGAGIVAATPDTPKKSTVAVEGETDEIGDFSQSDDFSWRTDVNKENSEDYYDPADMKAPEDYSTIERRCIEERRGPEYVAMLEEGRKRILRGQFAGSEQNAQDFFAHMPAEKRNRIIRAVQKNLDIQNAFLPPELKISVTEFLGLIGKESAFDPDIVSLYSACGLCQIMPSSAVGVGVKINPLRKGEVVSKRNNPTLFNIESNIAAGTHILRLFRQQYASVDFSNLAYNTGNLLIKKMLMENFPELRSATGKFDWKKYYQMRTDGSVNFLDLRQQVQKAEEGKKPTWRSKSVNYVVAIHGWEKLVEKFWSQYLDESNK